MKNELVPVTISNLLPGSYVKLVYSKPTLRQSIRAFLLHQKLYPAGTELHNDYCLYDQLHLLVELGNQEITTYARRLKNEYR